MVGLQSIVHLAFVAVVASQPGSGVLDSCPEPMKSLLRNRSLWGLQVYDDCQDGMVEWIGASDALHYYGEWPKFCSDYPSPKMVIYSFHSGLFEDCQMDADCGAIPCSTKCEGNQCVPMDPSCMNTTETFMWPSEFKSACPADLRDTTCKDNYHFWEAAGCDVFEHEAPEGPPPLIAALASQCLGRLTQYSECVNQAFEDPGYLEHRLSGVDELIETLTSFIGGGGDAPRCVKVDPVEARALGAIPCRQP